MFIVNFGDLIYYHKYMIQITFEKNGKILVSDLDDVAETINFYIGRDYCIEIQDMETNKIYKPVYSVEIIPYQD